MKRYMLLHFGFVKPTPEMMAAWKTWFASVAARTVENVGLRAAREVSQDGVKDLPWGADSITGYTIITADSLDEAEEVARSNPFVSSIRVLEIASH